jgi:hypothetical protein
MKFIRRGANRPNKACSLSDRRLRHDDCRPYPSFLKEAPGAQVDRCSRLSVIAKERYKTRAKLRDESGDFRSKDESGEFTSSGAESRRTCTRDSRSVFLCEGKRSAQDRVHSTSRCTASCSCVLSQFTSHDWNGFDMAREWFEGGRWHAAMPNALDHEPGFSAAFHPSMDDQAAILP